MKCLIVVYIIFPIGLYLILCPGPFTASFPEQFSFLHRFFLRYELTDEFDVPEEFTGRWEENHLAFPQGVDLFLCGRGMVAGLPRSTCLKAQKEETPCM